MDLIYKIPRSWGRRRSGLLARQNVERVGVRGTIVVVLKGPDGRVKERRVTHNIVTNDGDLFYAQLCAAETPTDAFHSGIMELGTGGTTVKTDDRSDLTGKLTPTKSMVSSFQTNETDVDNGGNGGVDIVTYLGNWAAGEATNAAITHVIITNVAPGATENCLMIGSFTSVNKTAPDTLKVFVNHELLGV